MSYRAAAQGRRPEDCRLILPIFYIDAFEQNRSRNRSVVGIYMSFANASMEETEAAESRYLLCLVPLNVDLFDALRLVIIAPMRLLERGYDVYFKAEDTTRHCYGSVYCILGDHPSQALCAGTSFFLYTSFFFS